MRKVKIAIIDTGIDINDNDLRDYIMYDPLIQLDANNSKIEFINDLNGHGTLCAKTILSICNNIEIYPIKIFDDLGRTNSLDLVNVLNKIIDSDVDIINISASTINYTYEKELQYVCDKVKESGKIIVCSEHNHKECTHSIPTKFKSVIGFEGSPRIYKNNQFMYNPDEEIQMRSNSKDCFIKFKNKITHFGKNSKACAVSSGIIADIIKNNLNISFNELEKILIDKSYDFSILNNKDCNNNAKFNINIANKLIDIVNENFSSTSVDLDIIKNMGYLIISQT